MVCLLERNGEDGRYFVERGQRHHFRKGFAFVQAGAEVLFQDGVCTNDVWCFGGKEVQPGHLVDDSRALGASEEESAVKEHGYPYLLQPNSALKIWRLTGSARHLAFLALVDRQALWYVHDLSEKTTAVYDMTDGKAQIVDDITFNDQQPCLFLSYANRSDDGLWHGLRWLDWPKTWASIPTVKRRKLIGRRRLWSPGVSIRRRPIRYFSISTTNSRSFFQGIF